MAKMRIVSRSGEPLRDRQEAGRLLGGQLSNLRGQEAVVLGIPRGGMIVAQELARSLDADLDIVFAHKLRAPTYLELAIGAIAEDGKTVVNEELAEELGIERAYLEREIKNQQLKIARRAKMFRQVLPRLPLEGRVVVVTDDSVATGFTTQATLRVVRQEHPKKLIAAIAVCPEEAVTRLAELVDEMICLRVPPLFTAIGQFYLRFDYVDDEGVLKILKEECQRKGRK